jgi:hypothetical protein
VPDEHRSLAAERGDEPGDVVDERADVVRAPALGLPVAAQVGCDRAVAGLAECGELMPPGAPQLGEAVQAEDERAVVRAVGKRVEVDPVRGEDERLDRWLLGTVVGESSHRRPNGHLARRAAGL